MNFKQLAFIAGSVANPAMCARVLREHAKLEPVKPKGWNDWFNRLADWIDAGMPDNTPCRVFVKGNGKLPFWSFSTLPGASFCPGASDCLNWCYSFKSWRNPPAFVRQLMNTLLMLHKRDVITRAWDALPTDHHIRLYVDGDFGSVSELRYWMNRCNSRADLKVYGYSKSFAIFLKADRDGIAWPDNYTLNLSGGHKYDDATVALMRDLPVVRGDFIGLKVDIGRKVRASDHGTPEVNKALREAAKAMGLGKVFTCPGKCGECTKSEHACGSRRFDGIPVVIAVH